jgi:zinc transporter 7
MFRWKFTIGLWILLVASAAIAHQHVFRTEKVAREGQTLTYSNGQLNHEAIAYRLQECSVIGELEHIIESESNGESLIQSLFTVLFPFGPGANSLLATTYISGIPNILLLFIPTDMRPSSLSILVSFAVGGLLGDVFLHLIPQTFFGDVHDGHARFVFVDEKRNAVLGLAMFFGFLMFLMLDKGMRIMSGGVGDHHGHSHHHSHVENQSSAVSTQLEKPAVSGLKKRSKDLSKTTEITEDHNKINSSFKLSTYLNIIADFSHNITDGLAITGSFYVSKSVGATTCLAIFCHEVPHEVGDFALLVQGGFSKKRALQAQFLTASGAYLGALIGIVLNTFGRNGMFDNNTSQGMLGTNVQLSDLTLPFTAGGFLYIATVGVIPEILSSQEDDNLTRYEKLKIALYQLVAMLFGIGIMFAVSWAE